MAGTASRVGAALLLALGLASPGPARALSLVVTAPDAGPRTAGVGLETTAADASQITFTVGLDAVTTLNGFDLTLAWDMGELAFVSATPLAGLAFDVAPAAGGGAGSRVAAIELVPATSDVLFSVTFDLLGGGADGSADFLVFVDPLVNGSGLAPGSLSLANPSGAGFDVAVPEPAPATLVAFALFATAVGRIAGRRKEHRA